MATAEEKYQALMQAGQEALNTAPLSDAAIDAYTLAKTASRKRSNKARALQMLSIAYSVTGRHGEAIESAELAVVYADGDELLLGCIMRDTNMAILRYALSIRDRHTQTLAIGRALKGFYDSAAMLRRDPANKLEMAVSIGYIGRALICLGRRTEAADEMREADYSLKKGDNRTYELNNLMWLIRAVPRYERKVLRDRIRSLSKDRK